MPQKLSTVEIYFIEEFAKLFAMERFALPEGEDPNMALAKMLQRSPRPCPASRQIDDSLSEDLQSERSPVLAMYFAEEFEKLKVPRSPSDVVPEISGTKCSVRRPSCSAQQRLASPSGAQKDVESDGDPDLSCLLYTSEAYLVLEKNPQLCLQ